MDGMKIEESLIPKIVGIVVAIIVVSVVLIPITNAVTQTEKTLENDGYYRMSTNEISGADTMVITWDHTKPTTLTIDGVDYAISTDIFPSVGVTRTVAFADDVLLRMARIETNNYGLELWYSSAKSVYANENVDLTLTIDSTKVTWQKGVEEAFELSYTGDWTVIDSNGNKIMKSGNTDAYMLADSEFSIAGISGVGVGGGSPTMAFFVIDGTMDDFTVTNPNDITISNAESTYTDASGYVDLYALEKITFTTTYNGTDVDQTYTYFVVPYQVTAELSQHLDPMTNTIISIIPIFVVLAILMGIVGLMYFNRNGQ